MERMKFGIKMHKYALRNGEIKLIRSHAKINVKSHFGRGGTFVCAPELKGKGFLEVGTRFLAPLTTLRFDTRLIFMPWQPE